MRINADSYLRLGAKALPFEAPSANRKEPPAAATARVRTTRIGFSLGKLGFEYSSEDYQLAPDVSVQSESNNNAKTAIAASSFSEDLDAEVVRSQILDEMRTPTDNVANMALNLEGAGTSGELDRRLGLAAYAETLTQSLSYPPRTLLATA
jgi:hypothetical protein